MEASKRASERPADRGHFLFVRRRRPGRRSETDCGSSKFCDKTNRKAASRGSGPERGYWWQGTRRKVGGDIRESDYARFLAGGANRTSSRQLRCTALCAMAAISCGLPVVAQEGWETAAPITEAGVVLVRRETKEGLGPALLRVLSDESYQALLAERSKQAHQRYFSWSVIAAQYARALRESELDCRTQTNVATKTR